MHPLKSYCFFLTVWTTLYIGSTCQGEEVDPLGGLRPMMNVPSEVETLQRQIDHLKVNQKPEVNESVPQKPKFPYLEKF